MNRLSEFAKAIDDFFLEPFEILLIWRARNPFVQN